MEQPLADRSHKLYALLPNFCNAVCSRAFLLARGEPKAAAPPQVSSGCF
jgi:hypothetical protein